MFKRELSTLQCVIYHAILHRYHRGVFSTTPSFMGEITMVFVPKLAGMWYVSYHGTYIKLIGGMSEQFFPLAYKLPWYLYVSY